MAEYKLGIDLGGTKSEVIVLGYKGEELYRQRVETLANDYIAILMQISSLVKVVDTKFGYKLPLGIGTPGAISPKTGLLRNSNSVCLNGKNIIWDLERELQRSVRIANDSDCFTLSEAMDGSAEGYQNIFGIIIGTGTGGGLVMDKKLLNRLHSITGEWGHNPLPWVKSYDQQRYCYCGLQGCIETYLSDPGLEANAKALTGLELNSREIVRQARQGNEQCQDVMNYYYDQLARALAMIINIIDPDAIVLGGGMFNIEEIYHQVPKRLSAYVFSDYVNTPLLAPKHGDSSGVRGAAWLWGDVR